MERAESAARWRGAERREEKGAGVEQQALAWALEAELASAMF